MNTTHSALALALSLAAGCGGPSLPSPTAPRSAASASAREAPVDDPTLALRADPPLPGESTEGWLGLSADAGVAPVHHHAH